jgi:hypothetical protein
VRWLVARAGRRVCVDRELVEVVPFAELLSLSSDRVRAWRREPVLLVAGGRPLPDGRWEPDLVPRGGRVVPPGELEGVPRVRGYRPHLASCPRADDWRAQR